jgi:hypothetical protein
MVCALGSAEACLPQLLVRHALLQRLDPLLARCGQALC